MKSVVIQTPKGERVIGDGAPCFVIAEVSANHNQDFDTAVAIIKAAGTAGADAVKIQSYTPDTMTIDSDKEWFQVGGKIGSEDNPESWKGMSLYKLYEKAYTPYEWFDDLKNITEELGMVFFSTPYEETAVDFLEEKNVPLYKVASYETTHIPLLKRIAATGKPVIVSTGFSTAEEIALAVKTLREGGTSDIILLHCTTEYAGEPRPEHVNLKTMLDLRNRFDTIVGFSDNSAGIAIPVQAVTMGAAVVEKHIVIENDDKAIDDKAIDGAFSLGQKGFQEMVSRIRSAEQVVGEVSYGPKSETEAKNAKYQRSIFAVKDIAKGEAFTRENTRVIRPNFGLQPKEYDRVLGMSAAESIEAGTPLLEKDLQ